jgi:hypothetical protein
MWNSLIHCFKSYELFDAHIIKNEEHVYTFTYLI